jgi:hypothetical protein
MLRTTTFLANENGPLPAGYRTTRGGSIKGPTDEQYPAGTGGPLPRPGAIPVVRVKIVETLDLNTGHTSSQRTVWTPDGAPAEELTVAKRLDGMMRPARLVVGRPVDDSMIPPAEAK